MALKALLLKKELDGKRSALAKLEERAAEFETRTADLKKAIEEMSEESTKEERDAVAEAVEKLDADKAEHDDKVSQLRQEIESLEKELEEEEQAQEVPADNRPEERNRTMENIITRDSKEYIAAYAEYVKGNKKADEVRALLTENASGTVPVPTFVENIIKTAWEKDGITSLIKKSYLRGNLELGFEISGTDAIVHDEGQEDVTEETLVLGIVKLEPKYIMKAVQVSKEALSMGPEAFLEYIYSELSYRQIKKTADLLVAKVEAAGTVSTTTAVGVPVITAASIGVGTIAEALGELSAEADNPVIIMNRKTWSGFKKAQYAGSFSVDPFEGLPVKFNNSIKAFSAASTGDTYVMVGDLGYGARANFPNGEALEFELDKITYKKKGLVEVMASRLGAVGLVAPNAFVKIKK